MEAQIIEQLKKMGKITSEDIKEALKMIPAEFERQLIIDIRSAYDDSNYSDDEVIDIWLTHFLPILRNGAFECMERARELNIDINPSIE